MLDDSTESIQVTPTIIPPFKKIQSTPTVDGNMQSIQLQQSIKHISSNVHQKGATLAHLSTTPPTQGPTTHKLSVSNYYNRGTLKFKVL